MGKLNECDWSGDRFVFRSHLFGNGVMPVDWKTRPNS